MCSLLRQLTTSSSRQETSRTDRSPNYEISPILQLDSQPRKISPKPVSTISIPGMDMELPKYDSPTSVGKS
jgi:hypothetical protein